MHTSNSLVSAEEVLDDFTVASSSPDSNPKEVAARKPKNISELDAIAHEECAKIPQKRCQELLSDYISHYNWSLQQKGVQLLEMLSNEGVE